MIGESILWNTKTETQGTDKMFCLGHHTVVSYALERFKTTRVLRFCAIAVISYRHNKAHNKSNNSLLNERVLYLSVEIH